MTHEMDIWHDSFVKIKEQTKTIMTKLHEFRSPEKPYSFEHDNFKEIKDFFTDNYK